MPLKQKNLKKKKAGGKVVKDEEASKASPKAAASPPPAKPSSPKQSPKAAPAAEPAEPKSKSDKKGKEKPEAKAEAKAKASPKSGPNPPKPGRAAPRPPPTEAEREEAMKKAISLIKAGLSNPKEQQKGSPFIPELWHQEFKPILGPYRKFVESCSCFRIEQGAAPANYTIHAIDGAGEGQRPFWLVNLDKAWQAYCRLKKDKKSTDEFLAAAKAAAVEPPPATTAEKGTKRKDEAPAAKSKPSKKAKTKAKE